MPDSRRPTGGSGSSSDLIETSALAPTNKLSHTTSAVRLKPMPQADAMGSGGGLHGGGGGRGGGGGGKGGGDGGGDLPPGDTIVAPRG